MTFAVLTLLLCIHGVLQKSSQNMVNSIQIPFYEDYQVELVDEQQENSTTCFNDCNLIIVSFMFYIYILLLF